jgi:hypothetical protein
MYDGARFDPALTRNVVFSQHNLVTDGSFAEFNVIVCRNVMIYFDRELQNRVHELFYDSLVNFGILGWGARRACASRRTRTVRAAEHEGKDLPEAFVVTVKTRVPDRAVGASAGGLYALRTLVASLPADFPMPVAVVQHRSKDSELLCELLQECTAMEVYEVNDKEEARPGACTSPPPTTTCWWTMATSPFPRRRRCAFRAPPST